MKKNRYVIERKWYTGLVTPFLSFQDKNTNLNILKNPGTLPPSFLPFSRFPVSMWFKGKLVSEIQYISERILHSCNSEVSEVSVNIDN